MSPLVNQKNTLELIATRNDQFRQVYEQLGTLIKTYDAQLHSLNQQLDVYAKMGEKATAAFVGDKTSDIAAITDRIINRSCVVVLSLI